MQRYVDGVQEKQKKTNTGKIFVTAEDLEQIKQRMAEFGTDNLSAHLRKLDLEGTYEIEKENIEAEA